MDVPSRPPRTARRVFAWRPDDADTVARLQADADQADAVARSRFARPEDRTAAEEARQALEHFLASVPTVVFDLESPGVAESSRLMSEHPPTAEQQTDSDALYRKAGQDPPLLRWNGDTFPPALIAASCTRVEITGDEPWVSEDPDEDTIRALVFNGSGFTEADQDELFLAARSLTLSPSLVPEGLVEHLGNG